MTNTDSDIPHVLKNLVLLHSNLNLSFHINLAKQIWFLSQLTAFNYNPIDEKRTEVVAMENCESRFKLSYDEVFW